MRVESLRENGKKKVRVRFDSGEEISLYRRDMRILGIEEDAEVDEEEYAKFISETLSKRATRYAMHILERMDRTKSQLERKLSEAGYPQECIDAAVAYVESYHYIDDYRYACTYVRSAQEKYGRRQIKMKLAQRGVSSEDAERALEAEYTQDEREQINELLKKRHYVPGCDQKEFNRTYQFLLRRGFSGSAAISAMKEFDPDSDEDFG